MALIIGTDTYISLADANTYLTNQYLSTDTKLVAWNAMTDGDNEVLLRKALKIIDRQPFVGMKAVETQLLQFPRTLYSNGGELTIFPVDVIAGSLYTGGHWYTQPETPQSVKDAQCEIALTLVSGESKRAQMQREGVTSFSVGGLSESYAGGVNTFVSPVAKELLAPFTGGGYRIC